MFFPRRESVRLLLDQFSKPQSVVKFTHQDQAAVGSDARALEGDLEGGVEEELKRLVWGFTHWVLAHRQRRETIPSFTTVCSYSGCSGHFCTSFLQASDSVLDPPREAQSVASNSAAHQKIQATVSFQAPTTRWIPTQGSGPAAHPSPVDGS